MRSWRLYSRGLVVLGVFGAAACAQDSTPPSGIPDITDSVMWDRMLESEDSRGAGQEGVAPLVEGVRNADAEIRRIAVRGLGRLERDTLAPLIAALLTDPNPSVRAEAANAIAQAVLNGDPDFARTVLIERLRTEEAEQVLGTLAESLGRLRHDNTEEVIETAELLTTSLANVATAPGPTTARLALRSGVARGLFFLSRQQAARQAMPPQTLNALRVLALDAPATDADEASVRLRTVAAATLVTARAVTADDLNAILEDPHPAVRREAVIGATLLTDSAAARAIAAAALADTSASVRLEALRVHAAVREPGGCITVVDAVVDTDPHVASLAIDLLASGCAGADGLVVLDSIASAMPAPGADSTGWHAAAHAVVSLARQAPGRAVGHLEVLAASNNPFARAWAARAAAMTASEQTLRQLASDSDANVRSAAIDGLARVAGHAADSVYIAQLMGSDDSQVVQSAAGALEGSGDERAIPALIAALDRLSAQRRQTDRDARVALLERISELADSTHAGTLRPRLEDFDPRIAELAADLLERWTGERLAVNVATPTRAALPTLAQVDSLARASATIEMVDGGVIELLLLPFDAPTNAFRFARLAREGYYDGLTFHRVVPNFVVQGGSPRANEYAGDGPFSRDELGLVGNWRGTVGLSTRGRDTGDAQIYFNLIDNVRLDHEYTVFALVTSGFDVVLRQLEGAVIRRVLVD